MQQRFAYYVNKFLSPFVYIIFIALVIFFTYYSFMQEKKRVYQEVDHQILAIAQMIPLLVAPDFDDRAISSSSISKEEFDTNMRRLNQIAKNFQVDYLYTCVKKDNMMYITNSSATDEELKSGINLVHYFDPYTEATPSMLKIFDTGKILYVENTDRWGTFRSVLVPIKSPNGSTYVAGVSLSLNSIQNYLKEHSIHHFLFGLGLILLSLPVFLWRHRRISNLAYYDSLTDLPNRMAFQTLAKAALNLCKRNNKPFALMFLDLDGFKTINDTLGHSIGDKLLIQVSKRLKNVLRKSDIPSRQGGDEFVIALPDTNIEGATFVSKKILEEIAKPYQIDNHVLHVTFSLGISMYPHDAMDLENLSIKADIAMYKAKKLGGNCFSVEND